MGSPLAPLGTSRRSRLATILAFTLLAILSLSKIHEARTLLLGRPTAQIPLSAPQQRPWVGDHGSGFELFGIFGFAPQIEAVTLNIKAKEVSSSASSSSHGQLSNPQSYKLNQPVKQSARYDATQSPFQYQLPIEMPKPTKHNLDSPDFNATDLESPLPGIPIASIAVEVPTKKKPASAAKLLFGLATSLESIPTSLLGFQHWASRTDARFVVVHEPQNTTLRPGEPSQQNVTEMFQEADIKHITLVGRPGGPSERFASLLIELYDRLEPQTEWAVLIDEETFFFDLEAVQHMLAKYDSSQPWYVGALSDNKWEVNHGGLYAVGGAGIFISRPLLEALRPFADTCYSNTDTGVSGDILVGECIHQHTTTKLSLEHGLHQLDLHGDATGFYEAARKQPLSVHNWKTWHNFDMPAVASVAKVCGPSCVLQNFRFQDGWQLSNGFSIVRHGYSETDLLAQHPEAMEHTWKTTERDIEDSWRYSLAPLKHRDEEKVQFLMEKSVVEKDGGVTMYYVRRENGIGKALIRLFWH
ncbi:hypothetical protein BD289DRAFT_433369 [Coniella lustricola]|uniref:Fringe-like glycosyltransferase domain-containing protein n=1 Tax=Coniella lustricola TaxID=2025994 RepID=A0A2T3A8K7_9PEZI|nr:hypothetical protein BD289DRAFT_433369 [Coniella lustricola]